MSSGSDSSSSDRSKAHGGLWVSGSSKSKAIKGFLSSSRLVKGPGSGTSGVVIVGGFVLSFPFPLGPILLVPNKACDDRVDRGF